MAKGSQFERDVARTLSLWWSGGEDDFLFWRTDTSGGRATSRAKKGLKTKGRCGDLCAIDGRGEALTSLVTIELKRGYNKLTPIDLIDGGTGLSDARSFAGFVKQATAAADRAGTPYWMVIHRRDGRTSVCYFPSALFSKLIRSGAFPGDFPATKVKYGEAKKIESVVAVTLQDFVRKVKPKHVESVLKDKE
jgi:hypothetical protein